MASDEHKAMMMIEARILILVREDWSLEYLICDLI